LRQKFFRHFLHTTGMSSDCLQPGNEQGFRADWATFGTRRGKRTLWLSLIGSFHFFLSFPWLSLSVSCCLVVSPPVSLFLSRLLRLFSSSLKPSTLCFLFSFFRCFFTSCATAAVDVLNDFDVRVLIRKYAHRRLREENI
jgi:hypothetical protein